MKPKAFEPSGRHLLADLHGILPDKLDDPSIVQDLLQESALAAGAAVLSCHFHSFGSRQGVTGVVLLAESHISIHTWPEYGFAAVDIFMCGAAQPERALEVLQRTFAATGSTIKTISRGLAHTGLEKKTA